MPNLFKNQEVDTPKCSLTQQSSWMYSLKANKGNVHTSLTTAPMHLPFQLTLMADSAV